MMFFPLADIVFMSKTLVTVWRSSYWRTQCSCQKHLSLYDALSTSGHSVHVKNITVTVWRSFTGGYSVHVKNITVTVWRSFHWPPCCWSVVAQTTAKLKCEVHGHFRVVLSVLYEWPQSLSTNKSICYINIYIFYLIRLLHVSAVHHTQGAKQTAIKQLSLVTYRCPKTYVTNFSWLFPTPN